ncbi:MAG TPA: hypothetical protein VGQ42_00615 [Candidatus Dormibacteraeota bacterium]|nr:hypothetical protein [Candidatus Dormibacteraeota bacterium]
MISHAGRRVADFTHSGASHRIGAVVAGAALAGLAVLPASAHAVVPVAPYTLAIGWAVEPAYVGSANAVEVLVNDPAGKPVNDLAAGALKVQVSLSGQTSSTMDLVPAFDADTGLGTPGDYRAQLIPTVAGAYSFHVTGDVHGTKVDQTVVAGDKTFAVVTEPSDAQFPTKVPSISALSQLATRDAARVAAAQKAADDASSAATRALVIGTVALVAGVVLGGGAAVLGMRRRRA